MRELLTPCSHILALYEYLLLNGLLVAPISADAEEHALVGLGIECSQCGVYDTAQEALQNLRDAGILVEPSSTTTLVRSPYNIPTDNWLDGRTRNHA